MEIKFAVTKKKNLERLDELTNDPGFIVSILKILGYKELPKDFSIKVGLIKLENKNED